ncbi:MAG TPA: hypothetical protein PLH91_00145 [Tenuifilaceae bacterium]|nr:hypothetical protein [Tenuifilaceae bacterium]HOZ13637.1 hypothetical protein [Tenuifilaceae bacterium]HPI43614.1 hypothetical protein [Tenuifilaceae bacterium]HPN21780.1 hypothetical protein [Tenuifilaceae bacterium]HPV55682.1 hypothetical protein [Tenuifilaceae bacterium]
MDNKTTNAVYDSRTNAAIGTFVGFLTPDEFKTVANQLLGILETKRLKKQLNDIKQMKVLKPEVQEWLNTDWFPRAQKIGLKYFAFVVPDDIFGKMSMDGANKNAQNAFGMEIQYFNNVDAAKNWLISKI